MNEAEVTLAILAGGRGERMGKPKSLLRVADQPILSYLLQRFEWRGPTMLVTSPGREKPPGAEGFKQEVSDAIEGMGPVRGLATALDNCRTELLVVASVDMPLIQREHLLWLLEKIEQNPRAPGFMLERAKAIEPFPSVFRKVRAGRAWYQDEDKPSMRSLSFLPGFAILPAPADWPHEVWTNLNEPADLAAFEKLTSYRIH